MNASNVRAFAPSVNPTPDDVCNFLKQKADRGEIGANAARLKMTAVNALVGILAEDEPKTAAYVRDNVADLASRWATLNNATATGDTARTYESRARTAIDAYFAWVADPKGFKFKQKPEGKPRKEKADARKEAPVTPHAAGAVEQLDEQRQAQQSNAPAFGVASVVREYKLGPDREPFRFVLPEDGIEVNDVRKIICHLLTLGDIHAVDTQRRRSGFRTVRVEADTVFLASVRADLEL